jgi:hypothetical protein
MIKFFEIPKNASRYANLLTFSLKSENDVTVCFLRDIYERFWDATKTIVPSISYYNGYPPTGLPKIENYSSLNIDYKTAISQALEMINDQQWIHFRTQSSFIGNKKFNEIFMVDDNLSANCESLVNKYNLETAVENFNFNQLINQSPKDLDITVMAYIKNTPSIQQQLATFYAQDIDLINNIESIKKL